MQKMIIALVTMLTMTVSASAMSYEQARNEALFLTDKMAYELNLTDAQYEAAYEINLDYLMGVTSYDDVFGVYWERRNLDLSYILYSWQWEAFRAATYFYRPLYWEAGYWHFGIYARYPHRDYFYFGRPHFYATYRGGHSWHLNGGRSYYHGRDSHFRPSLPSGRQHFGMRNSYDRGDFRGSHRGSSTRVTGRQNDNRSFGSGSRSMGRDNNRSTGSGRFGNGDMQRGNSNIQRGSSEMQRGSSEMQRSSGNFQRGSSSEMQRSSGSSNVQRGSSEMQRNGGSFGSSSRPTRSFGSPSSSSSRSSGSHSVGSSMSRPSGASHSSGSMGSRPSGGGSRSSGGGSSHGHFGGRR
jgi:hypothetical protein